MRQLIFVLSLFIAGACAINIGDDATDKLGELLSLTKVDVETCMNKTNINIIDLMKMDEVVYNELISPDGEKAVLKVACLFVCLLQKKNIMSGTYINLDNFKKLLDSKIDTRMRNKPDFLNKRDQLLERCNQRVRSKTDECEVLLKFYVCLNEKMYV